jgi:A/G-specific adenine glycosylase
MVRNFEIFTKNEIIQARRQLKNWFISNQRPLPWRNSPHPYSTWLCEIIMQQTRIDQGTRYWHSFLNQWPDFKSLAAAEPEEIMKAWQGLGYYSRARNLHKAAKIVANDWGNELPTTAKEWQQLPGVGPYTAAAIASICYGDPVAAVDGNALRVISRWGGIQEPIDKPAGRKPIEQLAQDFLEPTDSGMHNQAIMELGALICTPKAPDCENCPLEGNCKSRVAASGQTPLVPIKAGKTKVLKVAVTFHVIVHRNQVLMTQRPSPGIWGGLWEFPSRWIETKSKDTPKHQTPPLTCQTDLQDMGQVGEAFSHVLSHRKLDVRFHLWQSKNKFTEENHNWFSWEECENLPIPRAIDKKWGELTNSIALLRFS